MSLLSTPIHAKNLSYLIPLIDNPSNTSYVIRCADLLFRVQQALAHFRNQKDRVHITGLLDSDSVTMPDFNEMWNSFREGFLRSHKIKAIGTVERCTKGDHVGMLHMHIVMLFPAGMSLDEVKLVMEPKCNAAWRDIHKRRLGKPPSRGDKDLEPIRNAEDFENYIAKAFDRDGLQTKWGDGDKDTFIRKAYLPKGLWLRDQLPSRRFCPENVVKWYKEQLRLVEPEEDGLAGETVLDEVAPSTLEQGNGTRRDRPSVHVNWVKRYSPILPYRRCTARVSKIVEMLREDFGYELISLICLGPPRSNGTPF